MHAWVVFCIGFQKGARVCRSPNVALQQRNHIFSNACFGSVFFKLDNFKTPKLQLPEFPVSILKLPRLKTTVLGLSLESSQSITQPKYTVLQDTFSKNVAAPNVFSYP